MSVSRRRRRFELEKLTALEGPRLRLRVPQPADAAAVYAYASDPVVTHYLAWPRHTTIADSERFLQLVAEGWQSGSNLVWLIEDESGVVGAIGARLSGANAGVGYVLAKACWGRGYASEALQLVSEALFQLTPVQAMWAICVLENAASVRVLEKCGFLPERLMPRYFTCPNLGEEKRDVRLYVRRRATCRET